MAGTLRGELSGRSGGISATRTRTRKFSVISNDTTDYEYEILSTPGIPFFNELHPDDPSLRVRTLRAEQDGEDWRQWVVTADYEVLDPSEDPQNGEFDNPLLRLPEISIDTQSILVAARGEVNSSGTLTKAIVNSAGEPYDPHPEEELEILAINITRWASASFSMALYRQYQNAVNSSSWSFGDITAAEGDAKIRLRIGKREFWTHPTTGVSVSYRQYDFEVLISPIGWDIELLDWGPTFIDGAATKKFINDPDDGEGKDFGLLNGSGGKNAAAAQPVYLTWKNKKRVSFGALNLPTGP